MSLLAGFVEKNVLSVIESQLLKHEPEIQAAFLAEFQAGLDVLGAWVKSKLEPKAE